MSIFASPTSLQLKYWDGRGLMEVPRTLLAIAGKFPGDDYVDGRYTTVSAALAASAAAAAAAAAAASRLLLLPAICCLSGRRQTTHTPSLSPFPAGLARTSPTASRTLSLASPRR